MNYEELRKKKKPELHAIAKEKKLKYFHKMRKAKIIRALLLIQEFPTGWENLTLSEIDTWLENLEGYDNKLEFKNLMKDMYSLYRPPERCEHGKIQKQCKICEGCSICEHKKRKDICRICKPDAFCTHNRLKTFCKDCGGKSICPHGKQKAFCIPCGGSQICPHRHQKAKCEECRKK